MHHNVYTKNVKPTDDEAPELEAHDSSIHLEIYGVVGRFI